MRKVYLLLVILFVLDNSVFGQDMKPHHPFVYEGNVWYLQSDNPEEENDVTTYFFQGDTIIRNVLKIN